MCARIVDEFLVLERYRVMVLDRKVRRKDRGQYRINGRLFDPVPLQTPAIPRNYIAVKATASFKGAKVEFV